MAENINPNDIDNSKPIEIKVRPTVYIAVGGTGKEILLRLRRRILNSNWKGNDGEVRKIDSLAEFPIAAFLYFDVDTEEAKEGDKSRKSDLLAGHVAFNEETETDQNKLKISKYTKELNRYPHIKSWWPKANVDNIDVEKGAGQIRCISRLAFFDRVDVLNDKIRRKCKEVTASLSNENYLGKLGLRTQSGLQIVILASTAGGTGSGSFIDMGYLCRTIAISMFKDAEVNLMLLLPGGFEGANKDRVFANTFAAMMELEYCMRGNLYVDQWTNYNKNDRDITPFNEVYLLDTCNVAGQRTKHIEDLYSMTADVLFENFGSGEFASIKRSISVNQKQHKILPYRPEMGADFVGRPLAYSKVYSSFGQATLLTRTETDKEIKTIKLTEDMVRAFFQVTGDEEPRLPTPEERDEFMGTYLQLRKSFYENFPEDMTERPSSIHEYALLDALLQSGNKVGSILTDIQENINNTLSKIPIEIADRRDWVDAIEKIKAELEREVLGAAGSPDAAIRHKQVVDRCKQLFADWTGQNGLRPALYNRLDDDLHGGLDYTIQLVEQIKDNIGNDATGIIKTLESTRIRYEELADVMLKDRYLPSLDRFKETYGTDLLGSKKKHAEEILKQIRGDMYFRILYLLKAKVCDEAVHILVELSEWLGSRVGINDKGDTVWSGLVKEFVDGRDAVENTIRMIRFNAARLEDTYKRSDAMYMFIDSEDIVKTEEEPKVVRAWSKEAFKDYGGSKELFGKLKDNEGISEVVSQLRGVATRRLNLSNADAIPIAKTFIELANSKPDIAKNLLRRSIPWVEAELHGHFGSEYKAAQFKALIAIRGKEQFGREIFDIANKLAPMGDVQFKCEESGSEGRIITYVELSGFPLDVLTSLKSEWYPSYCKEMEKGLPLHNHKDFTRFPNPIVPSSNDLERMMRNIRMFIEAVGYGLLRRRPGIDGFYEMEVEPAEWQSVGNERKIKSIGFSGDHGSVLDSQLREAIAKLKSSHQLIAVELLFNDYEKKAYAPIVELDKYGAESFVPGLASMQAKSLTDAWIKVYERHGNKSQKEQIRKMLIADMDKWTEEIADSLSDIDVLEVEIKRAKNKRLLRPEVLEQGWLEKQFPIKSSEPMIQDQPNTATSQMASVQAPSAVQTGGDLKSKIIALKALKDEGILSEEEYKMALAEAVRK
jgi:hypothetical protein